MLLYNVTTIVEDSIAQKWQDWMQTKHIVDVMNTGLFSSFNFLKVLDSPNEGQTFCAQFITENREAYEEYLQNHAPKLREEAVTLFKEQALSFRTLMEYID